MIFPENPWSKGIGRGLVEGLLDWVDKLAEDVEVVEPASVLVDFWPFGAFVVSDGAIEVFEGDADDVDSSSSSSLSALFIKPRRWSASPSASVARVQSLGLDGTGAGRRSTRSVPESRNDETSALLIICSAIWYSDAAEHRAR